MVLISAPSFDSFSLQDSNYITAEVEYRTIPIRNIQMEWIARKPGKKYLSTEFGERHIRMKGWIIGSDSSNLVTLIDNLHTNITRKKIGTLAIDSNRDIQAVVASVTVAEPHYSQSMVPMELEFIAAEAFWRGTQQTISLTVTSGTGEPHTMSVTTTVSGSVFAEPSITYTAPGSTGNTTLSGIMVNYQATGETVTWSGGASTLAYGSQVKFDYENQIILQNTTEIVATGVFSRWEPGSTNFVVTFSGQAQGGTLDFVYRPRYL